MLFHVLSPTQHNLNSVNTVDINLIIFFRRDSLHQSHYMQLKMSDDNDARFAPSKRDLSGKKRKQFFSQAET